MEFVNRVKLGIRVHADRIRHEYGQALIRVLIVAFSLVVITSWVIAFSRLLHNRRRPAPTELKKAERKLGFWSDANFDIDQVQNQLTTLDQTNPQLIKYVRYHYLTPPSALPYGFLPKNAVVPGGIVDKWVLKFFSRKRNGIFVEAGAGDGGKGSHSLYFEKVLGWTGLLIECNPLVVPHLYSTHRKAWIANLCLGPTSTPGMMQFSKSTAWSYSGKLGVVDNNRLTKKQTKWAFFDVQTMPLFTILAALNYTQVDYFYFDIQSFELPVLRNFPFDKVTFKVLSVDVHMYNVTEKTELRNLLTSNSYVFVKTFAKDDLYVHTSQVPNRSAPT